MLGPPEGGGVWEHGYAIHFQGTALHLHIDLPALRRFYIKIQPAVPHPVFRPQQRDPREQAGQIRRRHLVWGLAIHIDQHRPLIHRHQIVGRLTGRVRRPGQDHLGPRGQQLPAPARILDMAYRLLAFHVHQGDEPVGPGNEFTAAYLWIPHGRPLSRAIIQHGYILDIIPYERGSCGVLAAAHGAGMGAAPVIYMLYIYVYEIGAIA